MPACAPAVQLYECADGGVCCGGDSSQLCAAAYDMRLKCVQMCMCICAFVLFHGATLTREAEVADKREKKLFFFSLLFVGFNVAFSAFFFFL